MTIGSQRAIRVLGFAGSLRRGSYNRALLRAASELAPEGMLIDIFDLLPIPLYNGDVEAQGDPMPVSAFKDAIRQADGVLMVTPEYNHGVPGVMKNAIDWASRPPRNAALSEKPVAIMGASPGVRGPRVAKASSAKHSNLPIPTRCRSQSYWSFELTKNSTPRAS